MWGPTAGVAAVLIGVIAAVQVAGSGETVAAEPSASPTSSVTSAGSPATSATAGTAPSAAAEPSPSASASPSVAPGVDVVEIGRDAPYANPYDDADTGTLIEIADFVTSAELSPDDDFMMVYAQLDEYDTTVQLIDVETGVDHGPGVWTNASSAAWVPGQDHLALIAMPEDGGPVGLTLVDAATGEARELGDLDGAWVKSVEVTNDGRFAAVTLGSDDHRAWLDHDLQSKSVVLVDLSDGSTQTVGASSSAGFVPDGSGIFLWSSANGTRQLILYDLGSDTATVTAVPESAVHIASRLRFSDDGSRAVFWMPKGQASRSIAVIDADGSDYRSLVTAKTDALSLDWVDAHTVMVVRGTHSQRSLALVDVDSATVPWELDGDLLYPGAAMQYATMLPDRSGAAFIYNYRGPDFAFVSSWEDAPGDSVAVFYTADFPSRPVLAPIWSSDGSQMFWFFERTSASEASMLVLTAEE
ncbi:hypothetical protein [Demequina zhanjiangensis]|uniref:WD40-like Beta Propeller Repeat n=1 Tax=Demequina zhanjiangensis TaxID=3051659 RepID=A0ABT8FYP9_9MICO|nr:hypothetical protein [Demequina sp. SYSU T00b26]MDN4471892.1 hypothetical protein [Demequina sp. SYSU T00b26]